MQNLNKQIGKIFALWFFVAVAGAQSPDTAKNTNDLYQSALQAYLAGDFDQAILMDSKALQIDPKDKKALAFLSLLVSEKDTANKTVIWIGGKPAVVENSVKSPEPAAPITVFQRQDVRSFKPVPVNNRKMEELETRIQTVTYLLQRDSFSQYRELAGAQAKTSQRLDELTFALKEVGAGLRLVNLLFLLSLGLAATALWKSWKNGVEIKRQSQPAVPTGANVSDEQNRVVNIRRM